MPESKVRQARTVILDTRRPESYQGLIDGFKRYLKYRYGKQWLVKVISQRHGVSAWELADDSPMNLRVADFLSIMEAANLIVKIEVSHAHAKPVQDS